MIGKYGQTIGDGYLTFDSLEVVTRLLVGVDEADCNKALADVAVIQAFHGGELHRLHTRDFYGRTVAGP